MAKQVFVSDGTQWLEVATIVPNLDEYATKELNTNLQSSSYSLSLSDSGKIILMSGGGTLTVPTDVEVSFNIGTQVLVLQTGTSQVTVAGSSGVTVNSRQGLKLYGQWSMATLMKINNNSWVLSGDTIL